MPAPNTIPDPYFGEITPLTPAESQGLSPLSPSTLSPLAPSPTGAVTPPPYPNPPEGGTQLSAPSSFLSRLGALGKQELPTAVGIGASLLPGGELTGAGAAGITRGLQTGSPAQGAGEALGFLGGAAVGRGIGKGIGALARSQAVKQFVTDSEQKLVSLLQDKVPAWAGMKSLVDMFHGQNELSQAYEQAMQRAQARASGVPFNIRADDALALGIPIPGITRARLRNLADTFVNVDAATVLDKLPGKWDAAATRDAYHRAVDTLNNMQIIDPAERNAYMWGKGALDYFDQTGMLKGEKYNPVAAAAGTMDRSAWDALRTRGMEEFANTVRGPFAVPLQYEAGKGAASLGGAAGLGAGLLLLRHPWLGMYAGREVGRALGGKMIGGPVPTVTQVGPKVGAMVGGPLGSLIEQAIAAKMGVKTPLRVPPQPGQGPLQPAQ